MLKLIAVLCLVLTYTVSSADPITGAVLLQMPVSGIITLGQWMFVGGEKTYYIEVEGLGTTPDESKNNGFKLAVEQAVGSIISSESVSVNNRLNRDEIISYASGYVTKFEVVDVARDNLGYHTRLKIWIKRSVIANRLLHQSTLAKEINGSQASVSLDSIIYERNQGDKLVFQVLNDFYSKGMNIQTKPASISLDEYRLANLTIPFRLSWDKNYLNSLNAALSATAQDVKVDQCWYTCVKNTSVIDISGVKSGFQDNVKIKSLIQTMILSQPHIELTLLNNNNQVLYKQCYHYSELDHNNDYQIGGYFVNVNTSINSDKINNNNYLDTSIQTKITSQILSQVSTANLKLVPKNQCDI